MLGFPGYLQWGMLSAVCVHISVLFLFHFDTECYILLNLEELKSLLLMHYLHFK